MCPSASFTLHLTAVGAVGSLSFIKNGTGPRLTVEAPVGGRLARNTAAAFDAPFREEIPWGSKWPSRGLIHIPSRQQRTDSVYTWSPRDQGDQGCHDLHPELRLKGAISHASGDDPHGQLPDGAVNDRIYA